MGFTVQTVYQVFDKLISRLRAEDHDRIASRLHMLLHEVAWTTSSELTGQLRLVIFTFQRTAQSLSRELQELLCRCTDVVKQVWPDIEQVRRTRE